MQRCTLSVLCSTNFLDAQVLAAEILFARLIDVEDRFQDLLDSMCERDIARFKENVSHHMHLRAESPTGMVF